MSQVLAARAVRVDLLRLGLGTALLVAVYVPTFPSLVSDWASFPSLSHGFAIPAIAGWLIWSRRHEIARVPFSPAWSGLALLIVGLMLYVAASWGSEPFFARISLPISLTGGALLLAGPTMTRKLLPGIGYLLFMIPLPYLFLKSLTDEARLMDAAATATLLPFLGVPVLRQGYLLYLPNTTLEVADVCSSIPAIVALLALGAAYGYLNRRPGPIRLALFLAAVPFGIASNIVRIISTAAGAYYLGPIALDNVIHMWNGTTVFLLTFGALALFDAGLARVCGKR